MADRKLKIVTQYGALPIAIGDDSRMRVMLVTARGSGDWIIPKGWPIANLTPAETAAREAYEEAGLVGVVASAMPIGRYGYRKGSGTRGRLFEVIVFALHVHAQKKNWPEKGERRTRWFDLDEAAAWVGKPELAAMVSGFAAGAYRGFMPTPPFAP
jgi:8-oxo-dGTP pyrophosphatase MutT (NUDIX family)